jgi:hypothetical protein
MKINSTSTQNIPTYILYLTAKNKPVKITVSYDIPSDEELLSILGKPFNSGNRATVIFLVTPQTILDLHHIQREFHIGTIGPQLLPTITNAIESRVT